MIKKKYKTPVWDLDGGGEDIIPINYSQDTTGEENIFDFEDDALAALLANLGYLDLQEIDKYGIEDGIITWDEYRGWLADHPQP